MSQSKKIRFERKASQVVFDPSSNMFVVTWTKCGMSEAERLYAKKDPNVWMPSIGAIATLYDRGLVERSQIVFAAKSIGRAWDAGDREFLDTEGARRAAELVGELASMCVNTSSAAVARDIGQAMRHLLDEMAMVKFASLDISEFQDDKVLPALDKSIDECFSVDGFLLWPVSAMRRRFLYCLNRKERTMVAYALVSILFDSGPCPLLSLSDRRFLRRKCATLHLCDGLSPSSAKSSLRTALKTMRDSKAEGRKDIGSKITQQQLADILQGSSSS